MNDKRRLSAIQVARLCALGGAAGVINGLFGAGGGVLIVFFLWGLASDQLHDRRRVFANVTAIILPISLASALVYFGLSTPDAASAVGVGIAAVIGGAVGAILLGKLNIDALRTAFAILLIVSGAIMIFG